MSAVVSDALGVVAVASDVADSFSAGEPFGVVGALGAAAVASGVADSFPAGMLLGVVGTVKSSATALSGVRALLGCEPVAVISPPF